MNETMHKFMPIQPVVFAWAQGYKAFKHEIGQGYSAKGSLARSYDKCPFHPSLEYAMRQAYNDGRIVAYMEHGNRITEQRIKKADLRVLV